jgi:hypothetical protein
MSRRHAANVVHAVILSAALHGRVACMVFQV